MKTFKTLLFLPVILFSFCSSKPGANDNASNAAAPDAQTGQVFKVHGKITNFSGGRLELNELTTSGQMRLLDTATVDAGGNFAFEGFVRQKSFGIINLGQYRNVFLVIDTTSDIKVEINNGQSVTYTVENSPESQEIMQIAAINTEYNQKIMDLDASFQQNTMATEAQRQEVEKKIDGLVEELKVKMAQATAASKSPLVQIFAIEMLQVAMDGQAEQKILNSIKNQPANQWYDFYRPRAEARIPTSIGSVAPDIILNDTSGKQVKLSSLKGKIVLIDFWASWCKPCRAENPNVVRLYNAYKAKGFEIYGVSLDNNAPAWKNAIKADGLTWYHVSDLGGWQSSAAKLYSVSSIPQTVLIDKTGKIIAKGLRGAALENKLKTLLN